ncbi:hypothetical protein L1856_18875 [Streptomyces sp. Tue 6430]|nr:hypothetical protein [Streptomyces sp. Tue 6430]
MTAAHESGTHDDGREARDHWEAGHDREIRGGHEGRDGQEGPDGREGRDGHEGRDGQEGHDGRGGDGPSGLPGGADGMDPLMAAILDVPPAEDARTDPLLVARHRAAAADVALLREQLGVLADALTRPPAAEPALRPVAAPVRRPAPVPFRPSRRRLLPLALKTAGLAAAGALVAGSGWLLVQVNGERTTSPRPAAPTSRPPTRRPPRPAPPAVPSATPVTSPAPGWWPRATSRRSPRCTAPPAGGSPCA